MLYTLSLILAIDGVIHLLVLITILLFLTRLHRRHIVDPPRVLDGGGPEPELLRQASIVRRPRADAHSDQSAPLTPVLETTRLGGGQDSGCRWCTARQLGQRLRPKYAELTEFQVVGVRWFALPVTWAILALAR